MCRVVEQITGRELNIHRGERRAGDPAVLCANPARIRARLGWVPRCSDLISIVGSAWQWEQRRASRADAPAVARSA
jgi:UDP-glucose 4-epimerase